MRFWWQWSSGRFSATIMHTCNSSISVSLRGFWRLTFFPSSLTTYFVELRRILARWA
nr:hypothetical protein Iba_chr14aCG22860 [Ipomoea batatas]GME20599.1 hypothetical protein Iba_scaffold25587CG0010 [Ipomoea batatas]